MTLVRRHRTLLPLAALLLLVGVAALSARHAAGPAPAQSPPAARLLPFSYFGLDEAAGDALDDSAGNHAGAAVRATPTPGKLGRARLLSAASQSYLDLGDIPQIGGATKLTVSAWVNLSAAQGQQGFVTKWGDAGNTLWTDFQNGTPRAAFAVGAFIAAKNFALPAGGWHHVVWSYDGTAAANAARLKLYVDGAARELEFGSHTVPPALASNATPVVVGSFKGQMLFLNGAVDEVGFWAEAAGAGLVANLYNANPNGGGAGRAVTYADIARADRLHRDSVVLLAHTHDFKRYTTNAGVLVDDFANAKAGGVTAMTAKLTTDGVDWDRPARLRCYIPPDPPDQTTAGRPCPAVPYRERFLGHLDELTAAAAANGLKIVKTADDIPAAKSEGKLGIILGSEGANQLEGDLTNVEDYYDRGWRETQLRWAWPNLLINPNADPQTNPPEDLPVTAFGREVIRRANRLGILLDLSHMDNETVKKVLKHTTAPVIRSHDVPQRFGGGAELADDVLANIVRSVGGHGVVAIHFCKCYYADPTFDRLLEAVDDVKVKAGVDHVALGDDHFPENEYDWIVPVAQLADVTLGLVRLGYSDEEVSKVLGRNLLDLYRRAGRPFKGRPDLRTCTNAESDPALTNLNRVCASAAANTGEGGMNQRPVNCRSAAAPGVIGLQISYLNGKWVFYSNDNTGARDCEDGSTLVASWPEPAGNARFEICTHGDADPVCAAAAADGGRGTASARAINCRGQQGGGVVGLQLAYSGGQWRYTDNLNPSLTHPCAAESVLVAEWGAASTPAQFRLCDNTLDDPVCQSAASGGGSGTDNVRAVNCANSTSFRGQLGLKLEYVSGRWMYRDNVDTLKPCVEGSVLVAERAAP